MQSVFYKVMQWKYGVLNEKGDPSQSFVHIFSINVTFKWLYN